MIQPVIDLLGMVLIVLMVGTGLVAAVVIFSGNFARMMRP